jgi:uncharacterized protein YjiS (DUF1127 family)
MKTHLPIMLGLAVSMMNINLSISRPYQLSRWRQAMCYIAEWRIRARSSNELMNLSDGLLQDIGVSRFNAEFEASKPFWMA